jgi:hypothetical protein
MKRSRKAIPKKVASEIDTAAAALGFPRRVSFARVVREVNRYGGTAELDLLEDRPRFRAVAALCNLIEKSRKLDRRIAAARIKLRREVIEQAELTRKRVDEFVTEYATWKALTPKQRSAIFDAEMKRDAAKRTARWEKNHGEAKVAAA